MSNGDGEQDYSFTVQQYSDEELLDKERSKRRRKTGDIVGTGLTAAAAIGQPALWAVAATSTKAFFGNSSKHKIILQEIERRGLKPLKGDMSDMLMPVLGSAGSMAVGRAFGGAKGAAGLGDMAGNLMRSASVRAFSGSSKKDKATSKKDKALKRAQSVPPNSELVPYSQSNGAAGSRNTGAVATQQGQQTLMTPSSYHVPRDQTPPATLVYHYYPPTAEYPRGFYAPAQTPRTVPAPQQPQPVYQQPQIAAQPPQQYLQPPPPTQQYLQAPPAMPTYQQQQPVPPALAYQYAQPEPQYYRGAPQQATYGAAPAYDAPPMYQPSIQRANTFQY